MEVIMREFIKDLLEDFSVWVIAIGFVLSIILFFIFKPFTIVSAGHTGVKLNLGAVSEEVLGEGINFKIPIFQSIKEVDNRIQKLEVDSASASKDLQVVQSKIAVNFRVDSKSSAKLYKNVGMDYSNTIIAPSIQESVKATTAKYTAEELITKRQDVSEQIKTLLKDKLIQYGIMVDNFNIVNFDFSKEFNSAIEAKQTAQQLTLKAEQDLKRVEVEAKQKIAQAQAEAESLKAQKQEITPDLLKLREIEAKIKAIEKWNGSMPQYVSGDNGSIFNIPIK
jgi:prohibitin 2